MSTLNDLLQQRQNIELEIQCLRSEQKAEAVAQCKQIIMTHGITEQDLFGNKSKKILGVVAPKYRNPETGETWTGRGKAPKWIADKEREQYRI